MAVDLAFLEIEQVVIHEVAEGGPVMSEAIEDPGVDSRQYFARRTIGTLAEVGHAIRFQSASDSKVPPLVRELLKSTSKLLEHSQECATFLSECQQAKTISPGLLCMAVGRIEKRAAVAIVKLDIETGVHLQRNIVGKKRVLSMKTIKDLMFTQRTRVFKAAVFYPVGKRIVGRMSDSQVARTSIRGGARFFLDKFLGCELEEEPGVTTARYFQAATKFIRGLADGEKQYRYDTTLHADLLSNALNVEPQKFARTFLDAGDRAGFLGALAENNIPSSSFPKDTTPVDTHLRKRKIEFESGLSLNGPTNSFDDHVTVEEDGGVVTVNDKIAKVGRLL